MLLEFLQEGITEEVFASKAVSTIQMSDVEAIIPRIKGKAFITGFHQFVQDTTRPRR